MNTQIEFLWDMTDLARSGRGLPTFRRYTASIFRSGCPPTSKHDGVVTQKPVIYMLLVCRLYTPCVCVCMYVMYVCNCLRISLGCGKNASRFDVRRQDGSYQSVCPDLTPRSNRMRTYHIPQPLRVSLKRLHYGPG